MFFIKFQGFSKMLRITGKSPPHRASVHPMCPPHWWGTGPPPHPRISIDNPGGGGVGEWLTPNTYIQLAGAGSICYWQFLTTYCTVKCHSIIKFTEFRSNIIFRPWVSSHQHFHVSYLLAMSILAQNTSCKIMNILYWILLLSRRFLVLLYLWIKRIKVVPG